MRTVSYHCTNQYPHDLIVLVQKGNNIYSLLTGLYPFYNMVDEDDIQVSGNGRKAKHDV